MNKLDPYIYLDHAATTPVDPLVAAAMTEVLAGADACGNPASDHGIGRLAQQRIDTARRQLASLVGSSPSCLVFTSGATESNNLAITGAARARAHKGRHLVTMSVEHKAVTDTFAALEREGFEVSWLAPQADGLLDFAQLEEALREDTQLVSIMYVNNETGVVQDIARIGTLCRQRGVLFHVDAAQAVGKLDFQVSQLPIDFLAMTAHKFYGPKGIGALYIADRPGCRVEPIMFGGGQERRMRPGTLPVHQVAGMGVAAELAAQRRQADLSRVGALRRRLWQGIRDLPGLYLNGRENDGYPGILNVSACDIDGESLLLALRPLCVARGSACNTRSGEPSHVLRALGRDDQLAQSAIRFGIGRGNSEQDIDTAVSLYRTAVTRLRRIAPKSAA